MYNPRQFYAREKPEPERLGIVLQLLVSNMHTPWTETEAARFLSRKAKLQRIGMAEPEADELAERLLYRDRDGTDGRRVCLECKNWSVTRCKKLKPGYCSVPTMLQNCDGFVSGV